jgi:hypothetical protein
MATATSRKAAPSPKVLKRRRELAEERVAIERKLQGDYATIAKLDAELKGVAGDLGDSFTERFGADSVTVAPPHDKEFKGDVPVVQTEPGSPCRRPSASSSRKAA